MYKLIKVILPILILVGCKAYKRVNSDIIYAKNKIYYYNTFYVDVKGDTIISDSLSLQGLDRPWIGQFRRQEAVKYRYFTDTLAFNNYVDPEKYFNNRHQKYIQKHGYGRISAYETTGVISNGNSELVWIHPPRVNQFRMLFYSPYACVYSNALNDSTHAYEIGLKIYFKGILHSRYEIKPKNNIALNGIEKIWEINAECRLSSDDKSYENQVKDLYNSDFEALFCKEYGFLELNYDFHNGNKIKMKMYKIIENDSTILLRW